MTEKPLTPASAPEPERRRQPRKGTFWQATLKTPEGSYECRVMNLSPRGAKVEIDHAVGHKAAVTLIMEPLGEFIGVVAWRRPGLIGVRINEHRKAHTEITLPRWVAEDGTVFGKAI